MVAQSAVITAIVPRRSSRSLPRPNDNPAEIKQRVNPME
jgi:hypothetical protein